VTNPRPLVVLTGFLGAGKTSLLCRLAQGGGLDGTVVLVNEIGEISIDGTLLRAARADVVDLAGGAACCVYDDEDDLERSLSALGQRPDVRRFVLETSGLAHPMGIFGLLQRPPLRDLVQLTGLAVVVDVPRASAYLGLFEEARAQVRSADRVAFSKLAGVAEPLVHAVRARVQDLNPALAAAISADAPVAEVTNWLWTPGVRAWPPAPSFHDHAEVFSVSLVDYAPYDVGRLRAVLDARLPSLLRVKGFVWVTDRRERAFLECSGQGIEVVWGEPFGRVRPRTELVVIGAGGDGARGEVEEALRACRERK